MKVVYTAITGGKDILKENQNKCDWNTEFMAFMEEPTPKSKTWMVIPIHPRPEEDPRRVAKQYKIIPHHFLPKMTNYSLWIDGSITLKVPIQDLINKYLRDADLALFKHPGRDCIYEEANTCKTLNLDIPEVIDTQMRYYKKDGYPEHNGLCECTILLRRHTKEMDRFDNMWWREITGGSRRDQLSFNYVAWKTSLKYNFFPGSVQEIKGNPSFPGNPYFSYEGHEF